MLEANILLNTLCLATRIFFHFLQGSNTRATWSFLTCWSLEYFNASLANFNLPSRTLFVCLGYYTLAFRILVPWPRIKPRPPAVKGLSPNHWTTRKCLGLSFIGNATSMGNVLNPPDFSGDFGYMLPGGRRWNSCFLFKRGLLRRRSVGTYLVVQWLRLCDPTAVGTGSMPGQGRSHVLLKPKKKKSKVN